MALRNVTRQVTLAENPRVAAAFWTRARGMIGRKFDGFDAMIFPECAAVHTLLMSQSIDVIFVDADGRVLAVHPGVSPWRPLLTGPRGTFTTIELPAGRLAERPSAVADQLSW